MKLHLVLIFIEYTRIYGPFGPFTPQPGKGIHVLDFACALRRKDIGSQDMEGATTCRECTVLEGIEGSA